MSSPTNYFILVYDMATRQVAVHPFGSSFEDANKAYVRFEDELSLTDHEVVLVGADSLDTIKRTHSPYFTTGTAREIVDRFLAAIP